MSDPDRRRFLALTTVGLAALACAPEDEARRWADDASLPDPDLGDRADQAPVDAGPVDAAPDMAEPADMAEPPLPEAPPVEAPAAPELGGPPWALGVASGDPLPEAVVIWTRVAVDPVAEDGLGGLSPDLEVPVLWEVAADPAFDHVVRRGLETARVDYAWSVHVDVDGLRPDRWWWYRFRLGGDGPWSPVGRARTAPADDAQPESMRLGVATCQHFETNNYAAHRHLAEAELDLVFFQGDYIYEGRGREGLVRQHLGGAARDLASYRRRYGQYKADAHLQAAHAACPWVVTWDDHEYRNNYAGGAEDGDLTRRAMAYQVWWEHQPVRMPPPDGPSLAIHRALAWGDLFDCWVLDTRQYRDAQLCGGSIGAACPEFAEADPARTILGAEQRAWLIEGLRASTARWRVLSQQVLMLDLTLNGSVLNPDQWDGYRDDRARVLSAAMGDEVNLLVLTGDAHAAALAELPTDARLPDAPQVGVEVMTTSISSEGIGSASLNETLSRLARLQPHIHHFDAGERGYAEIELGRDQWRVTFQIVEDPRDPASAVVVQRRFVTDRMGVITEVEV